MNEGWEPLSAPSLLTLPPEPLVGTVQPTQSPQPRVDVGWGMLLALGGKKKPQGLEREAARRLHGVLPSPPPVPVVPARCPGHRGSVPRRGLQGGVLQVRGWVRQKLGGNVAATECSAPRTAMSWGRECTGKARTARTCPGSLSCPRAPSLPPPQRSAAALSGRGSRVPMRSRPGRPAAPHRRAVKNMNKLLLINTL